MHNGLHLAVIFPILSSVVLNGKQSFEFERQLLLSKDKAIVFQ